MPAHRKADTQTALIIKMSYRPRKCSMGYLARQYGLSKGAVQKIVNGLTYKEIR